MMCLPAGFLSLPGQDFTWEADGSISGERTLLGLPALSYLRPNDAGWQAWNKVGLPPQGLHKTTQRKKSLICAAICPEIIMHPLHTQYSA